ncbi:MAG: MBL fold metallo-hydrolase [Xanthomonadales bacterium]|nr:MBL fold metallo-hydrolase [Gammaproteobacteria bacterium]MBT8052999.1 MBL fold metallo-hydrolase [Gammaproteobacteria bacterium]NND57891.1 MBL fold metallo-hydrolase [Xanthomonadales bacterium]NNK50771.1 MBL fold metallo-hydrolase [Xanthomonadales bacterium]
MKIRSFYEPDSGTWTHLLADPAEKAAAIIDPVWVFDPVSGSTDRSFIDRVLAHADQEGYRVEWALETHAHADHLTAAELVRQQTGARLACGRGICAVQKNFARVFNMKQTPVDGSQFDRLLVEGDVIQLGRIEIKILETPGHTSDSITYLAGDAAFIGDTLFAPAYGTARCDFPGGDAGQLYDSIRKLYRLPGQTRLFLCHDYPAEGQPPAKEVSVAESRERNIHLQEDTTRTGFVSMRNERDSQLGLPRLILPSLQVNILAGAAPEPDSNGVTYLRTPFNRTIAELIKEEEP